MKCRFFSSTVFPGLLFLLSIASSFAQRALTEIPNADPVYELSLLEAADGFEISLFASDPMIAKPTAMAFDAKGRLFVACTPIYPHVKPGELPSDQIIRLEDTDGDGKADKSTVFADGLLIPTAVLPNPNGVYVANSTELLFFEDRNDDGVADNKRILYSGFGTEDTHHIIHTLRQGPAGRVYFNQSIYTHSHVETPYGYRDLQAGGVWQFRPETLELEVYDRGLLNSWGFQFDRWGQTFQTDGAGAEGIAYSFPGAVFLRNVGYDRFLPSLNPGQPKFSGLEIIDGPHFPEDWQGRLVTCDFRGNRISSFKVTDSNSGFVSEKQVDLVTSIHGAFRPIDLQNGPDGALYVADWYNPIIQHGEVDFRDERRDHSHGRIWRISVKDNPLQISPDFSKASVDDLLDHLMATNAWTRDHAKRELKHRGSKAVLSALDSWIKNLNPGQSRYEEFLLQALWVSQSLDAINTDALEALLDSQNFKARAAALRVLEERPANYPGILERLEKAVADESPRVRHEAIHILRKIGNEEAAQLVVKVLDSPMDYNLDFSLWHTMRQLTPVWLTHARLKPGFFGPNLQHLLYAIRSGEVEEAIQPLERLWESGAIGSDDKMETMVLLAERGSAAILAELLDELVALADRKSEDLIAILNGLESSTLNRSVQPPRGQETVIQLLSHQDAGVQQAAVSLLGNWKLESALEAILTVTSDPETNDQLREAAIEALVGIGSNKSRQVLSELASSDLPYNVRVSIASGYAHADPRRAVSIVVNLIQGLDSQTDGSSLIVPYLSKPQFPVILANALKGVSLDTEVATALLRRASTAAIDTSELKSALQTAAGIEAVNQSLSGDEMRAMIEFVENYGDAAHGEQVYRRQNLLCATCHAIGGAGGTLGPDFTSIGASAPVDYLIDSLLQPQKQIKEGYHVVMITRKNGSVAAGRLAFQNNSSVTLQDAADQLIEIPNSDIASQEISPISLMPPGLTQSLRKDEFADLIKFMSQLGKEGDFKVTPNRFIRTYSYLDDKDGDEGLEDTLRHKPIEYVTTNDPRFLWLPTYARTDGFLPLQDLPHIRRYGVDTYRYLRFFLETNSPGDVVLKFNDPEALILFVGGTKVDNVSTETKVTLQSGINQLILAEAFEQRKENSLRIEVLDAPNGSAQVQLIHGK